MSTQLWVARDKNGELWLFTDEPIRDEKHGCFLPYREQVDVYELDMNTLNKLTWVNSPKVVKGIKI